MRTVGEREGLTDSALLLRFCREGDQRAFSGLVDRHHGLVRRNCWRCLWANKNLVDDALQATFVLLARKARHLVRRKEIASWLHHVSTRVCANLVREHMRRLRREREYLELETMATEEPEDEVVWSKVTTELDEAIASLPERYRVILTEFYFMNKSCQRLAEELGCRHGAIRMSLSRARRRLRKTLKGRDVRVSMSALSTDPAVEG